MSISTYSELQTAVQNWLDDTNTLPAARCQEFIALAEADINRVLRVREMMATATGVVTAGTATLALPTGFGGMRALLLVSGGVTYPLHQMSDPAAADAYLGASSGLPEHFSVEGSNVRLYPTPDSAYSYVLRYWMRVPTLSTSTTTNWLLTAHPDVYLFGSLAHAEGFRINDQRLVGWRALYTAAVEQVREQSISDGMSGSWTQYIEGGTP
jgi:hypothetical protein